jgi:hypothetical protein
LMRIKNGFRGLSSGYYMLVDVLPRIENILQVGVTGIGVKYHVIPGIDQSLQSLCEAWGTGLPLHTFLLKEHSGFFRYTGSPSHHRG